MHDTLEVFPGHLLIKSQSAAFYSSRKHGQKVAISQFGTTAA